MFVHSLDDRDGGLSQASAGGSGQPGAVWLRMEGRTEGSHGDDGTFKVNTDSFLLQGGGDVAQKKLTPGADLLHLGLMATYETAHSNVEAAGNPAGASADVAGYSVGAYGTWYQNEASRLGAYADTWFQYGWFNNSVEGDQLPTVNYNAQGWAMSGEVGYAFPLISDWVFEPQAQVLYTDYHENSLTEPTARTSTAPVRVAPLRGWESVCNATSSVAPTRRCSSMQAPTGGIRAWTAPSCSIRCR
jgi:autotransporter family porin